MAENDSGEKDGFQRFEKDDSEFKAEVVRIYEAVCALTAEDDQTAVAVAMSIVMGASAKVEGKNREEFLGLAAWAADMAELDHVGEAPGPLHEDD